MSTHTAPGSVPEWDLYDRMRKSLRHAGLDNAGIAAAIDVDPATVSRWLTGKQTITVRTIRAWALATGVSYAWLSGSGGPDGLEQDSDAQPTGFLCIPDALPVSIAQPCEREAA